MAGGTEGRQWGLGMSLRPPRALTHVLLSLQLLVSRRPGVFLVADLLVLSTSLVAVMFAGGEPRAIWTSLIVMPLLLLGCPILSDVVAAERRSGSLDLALASPGAATLFERRILSGLALLVAQTWLIVLLTWIAAERLFALVPVLAQGLLLCLLMGSATLFWAVRLRTPAAVMLATMATFVVLGKWALTPPIAEVLLPGSFFLPWRESLAWLATSAVLLGASAILYLHARRRLSRPEILLR